MRGLVVVGAAVAVAAVTVGAVVALGGRPSTPVGASGADVLLVRDGDPVAVSGLVVARPGEPVRLCAPPGFGAGGPDCPQRVEVRGVNLDALADKRSVDGAVTGHAYLRGTWHALPGAEDADAAAGVVEVVSQSRPPDRPTGPPDAPANGPPGATGRGMPARPGGVPRERVTPCPEPAGGWSVAGPGDGRALHDFIGRFPGRFAAPWIAYPDGLPDPGTTATPARTVLVVEVLEGDPDRARAELEPLVDGNLCVVRAAPGTRPSGANEPNPELRRRLDAVVEDPAVRVHGVSVEADGMVTLRFVVLDQRVYDALAPVGFQHLRLRPWVVPVDR